MQKPPSVARRILRAIVMITITLGVLAGGNRAAQSVTFGAATTSKPTISTLNPTSTAAQGIGFTLTVDGTNFNSASTVYFGSQALVTTFGSTTELTAEVPASAIAHAGKVKVIVSNSRERGYSEVAYFSVTAVTAARPTITSLSPASIAAGSPGFTLTVNGAGYVSTSRVYFGTTLLSTTFVSATQLTAAVSSAQVAHKGTLAVVVINGTGDMNRSTVAGFSVTAVVAARPTITSLSPASVVAGSSAFTLTVNGTGFVNASHVYFGTTALTTTFVSDTQVTAAVPAASVANTGGVNIVVGNSGENGRSEGSRFYMTPPPSTRPTISALDPTSVVAGGADFTLTITGTNFVTGSHVYFGTTSLTTSFVSATELAALVPAVAVAKAGKVKVIVANGGEKGTSEAASFTVTPAPHPTIVAISPAHVVAGSSALTLTVNGTGFVNASLVYFGTASMPTTFVSGTQVTVAVPASFMALPTEIHVKVGTGELASNQVIFAVTPRPVSVVYYIGKPTVASDDGIFAYYRLTPSAALDLTQPVSISLDNPATTNGDGHPVDAVNVFQAGPITLGAGTASTGDLQGTVYQYKDATVMFYVVALTNGQYQVAVSAKGQDLTSINRTRPVVVTLTMDGQTFQTQVTPSTAH